MDIKAFVLILSVSRNFWKSVNFKNLHTVLSQFPLDKVWITNQTGVVDLFSKIDRNIDISFTEKSLTTVQNEEVFTWFIHLRNSFRIWKINFFINCVIMCLCVSTLKNLIWLNMISYNELSNYIYGQKGSSSWMTWNSHFCMKNM